MWINVGDASITKRGRNTAGKEQKFHCKMQEPVSLNTRRLLTSNPN